MDYQTGGWENPLYTQGNGRENTCTSKSNTVYECRVLMEDYEACNVL